MNPVLSPFIGLVLVILPGSLLLLATRMRRRVLRSALALDEDQIRTMGTSRLIHFRTSLVVYLATSEGGTISEDPRVIARLALFDELLGHDRQRRALKHVGLMPSEQEPTQ